MAGKQPIDSINMLLEECIMAYPISPFVISLYKQYRERGSLSKKQLQGLYDKASKIKDLPPGKLAAVEVIIKRMPTRDKSALPVATPMYKKDEEAAELIQSILERYPQHKRVLFLKNKFDNNEIITPAELADLKRLQQVLK